MKIQTAQIELVALRDELDFFDQQSVRLSEPLTPLEAWSRIMADPLPLWGWRFGCGMRSRRGSG